MKGIIFICLFTTSINALAQEVSGRVVAVLDGNTIEVMNVDNAKVKLVLYGIDSPELSQEFGEKAKNFLEKLVLNKEVAYKITGKDRWGNYLAVVMKGNTDPRIELLEEGLAWTAEKNPLPELEEVRLKAFEKGKGLWKEEKPTPPWIYRRQQSMMQAKSN
jgi:micrococcal nuclease